MQHGCNKGGGPINVRMIAVKDFVPIQRLSLRKGNSLIDTLLMRKDFKHVVTRSEPQYLQGFL